jgi:hypothetical protein
MKAAVISPPPELKETKGREGHRDLAEFAVHGALAWARNEVVEPRRFTTCLTAAVVLSLG